MSGTINNIDDFISSTEEENTFESSNQNKTYQTHLYKKWFRSKTQSGFLTIFPWFEALKLKIDIGKTSADGKLLSSTNVFVDLIDFGAYLRSVVNGNAITNFPQNQKLGVPTDEGFVSYGGASVEGKPISRIFKSHYWQSSSEDYDSSSFVWKCGHFAARKTETGAFIPDMKSPISVDSIKVTRQDICSISYLVDLATSSYVSNNTDWYEK